MASYATVEIDGNDVTNVSIAGTWTPRLNRPAQCQITIPMDSAIGSSGSRLKLSIDGNLVFHGFVLTCETDTGKDGGTTVYNAQDPMELWQWRPTRDDTGDFSDPQIITDYLYGPSIVQGALFNTEGSSTAQGNPALNPPTDAEGPTFLTFGTFASGSSSLLGAPVDWPMTIAELASLCISTGTCDIVITPTDPGGGIMGTVDGYAGDYGTDLSGSVNFQYGTGAFNVDSLRWNQDMTNVVNKYWLFSGPKIATAADPQATQHFCFNVTGDDSGLPGYPASNPYAAVITRRNASQAAIGVRMKVDIFDGYDPDCTTAGTQRELQRWLWTEFSYISPGPAENGVQGRELIHITPTRDTEIGTFGIGDIVGVEAVSDVRGGFSGKQRVYEYTVSWDEDSVLALSELQTSSDADF